MTISDPKADLHRYLQIARDAVVWKLEGVSEYDVRRPLTPTGTNLLGMVKHLAFGEFGYFGDTFGRPPAGGMPWSEDDDPTSDMWASADESREQIIGLYHRAWAHSDETINSLSLDAVGRVQWWPGERAEVNLHQILIHMLTETNRHAGHADIVRELIDGAAGLRQDNSNLPEGDQQWWQTYRDKLEHIARQASQS